MRNEQPAVRRRGRASDPAPVRTRKIETGNEEQKMTRRMRQKLEKQAEDKRRFLVALKAHVGVITYACEEVGLSRRTIYNWIEADEEFAAELRDVEQRQIDFVERKLLEGIARGNAKLITFYMGTKGGERGYRPRVMLSTPKDEPFETRDVTPVDSVREEMGGEGLRKAAAAAMKLCPEVFGIGPQQPTGNG